MRIQPESVDLRLISHHKSALGENPLWHLEERCLYWCDITAGRLLRYDPAIDTTEVVLDGNCEPQNMIGGFTIEADGALLLFMACGRVKRWFGGVSEVVMEDDPNMRETRYNDVIADVVGRVFCGTMSTEKASGKLYRLDLDKHLTPVVEDVGCSNGLAFTHAGTHLYYTDSTARTLTRFAYEASSGNISNPQLFVHTHERDGVPDGMTVDVEDHVWSAHWDGGFIVRYDPSGEEVRRISIPAVKVTSLTFGGDDLRTLFVTTAADDSHSTDGSLAGNVFALEPGVCGVPEFPSRICST
jgi:sugar lactone lactonase YvrE